MNSVHRLSYTAGELRFASSRARGRLGVALARWRLPRGFFALPWSRYKPATVAVLRFLFSSVFPVTAAAAQL